MSEEKIVAFTLYGCKQMPPIGHGGVEWVVFQYVEALKSLGIKVYMLFESKVLDENYKALAYEWRPVEGLSVVFNTKQHVEMYKTLYGELPQSKVHMLHWRSPGSLRKVISPSRYTSIVPLLQGRDVVRIPHPLYLDRENYQATYQAPNNCSIEKKYALPDTFLFCAARVCKFKNIKRAIEISRWTKHTLVWAGPVEDQTLLKTFVDSGGVFLGDVPHADVLHLMRRATAVLCVTRYLPVSEPYGLFQVEALLAGAKVISSASGGLFDTAYRPNTLILPNFVPVKLCLGRIKAFLESPASRVNDEYIARFAAINAVKKLIDMCER